MSKHYMSKFDTDVNNEKQRSSELTSSNKAKMKDSFTLDDLLIIVQEAGLMDDIKDDLPISLLYKIPANKN